MNGVKTAMMVTCDCASSSFQRGRTLGVPTQASRRCPELHAHSLGLWTHKQTWD